MAVKTAAVAIPEAFVTAVFAPLAKVPLAPLTGGAKVTVTPLTGLLPLSVTATCNCWAYGVPTVAVWGVPAVAATFAAGPVRFVREKLAGVETPETEAVTI